MCVVLPSADRRAGTFSILHLNAAIRVAQNGLWFVFAAEVRVWRVAVVSPSRSTQNPSIFFFGDDQNLLLQCAEALVDFFPSARLSLPFDLGEALTLAVEQRFDLVIVSGALGTPTSLLRTLSPGQRVLSFGPARADAALVASLEFHLMQPDSTPRETALRAAVLLGLDRPIWNLAWGEALRLISAESLTVRVSVEGPHKLIGDFYFVRGKPVASRVTDASGRSFTAEDLLYQAGIEFRTQNAESVLATKAGRALQSLIARGGGLTSAESTIFPPAVAPSTVTGLRARQTTVSIVEDDSDLRATLCQLVEEQPDFVLLDAYGTAEEALGGLMERPPAVALCDLNLPGLSGLQLIARLAGHLSGTSFLALSSMVDDHHVSEFLRHGGAGYLWKSDLARDLPEHIRAVAQGGTSLSPGVARRLLRFFGQKHPLANPALSKLNPPEAKLLDDLARGQKLQDIAGGARKSTLELGRQLRSVCRRYAATARAHSLANALSP